MPGVVPPLPTRLLAGGGPSTPDARVLQAMTLPVIGQFDPAFTAIMDDVMVLARQVFVTDNVRCFPVTGLTPAGLEAVFNTLLEPGDRVLVDGSALYRSEVEHVAVRYGAEISNERPKLRVLPHLDPFTGEVRPLHKASEEWLVVDATMTLGGVELRTDGSGIDVVVAGVDACLGAPPGMTLVTYADAVEAAMQKRQTPPPTSYLDLLQLQAYWSPERLNHHTAPTALVYGLREALRLVIEDGLEARWRRHAGVAAALHAGLTVLGVEPRGEPPLAFVQVPQARALRQRLLDDYSVYVEQIDETTLRLGLLGADARLDGCMQLLAVLEHVLAPSGTSEMASVARAAFEAA